jgi:hypothetical protein
MVRFKGEKIYRKTTCLREHRLYLPGDSSRESRLKRESDVRDKFNDIFKVSSCDIFEESFLNSVSDDISVAGCLSRPSIQFFESIGASEFVLKTLRGVITLA